MSPVGLFRLAAPTPGPVLLARGDPETGPAELLDQTRSLDEIIAAGEAALIETLNSPAAGPIPPGCGVLAPIGNQTVWAAGVTFERSRSARIEESGTPDHYDRVYVAERPELFYKAAPETVRGPGAPIGVRADSTWDVPEPELALIADPAGQLMAATIGDDVSSRSIEGDNPLYLPQAKVYDGSCALGPCLVPWSNLPGLSAMRIVLVIERSDTTTFSDSVELSSMRRDPKTLIDWLYRALTFPTGAVLLTGTSIVPPSHLTLQPDDQVSISITGLGTLTNQVQQVGQTS